MNPILDNKDWVPAEPVGVELSLSSPTIMVGEPLVLFYSVTNALPEMLDTYMGLDLEGWLTYKLVDAAGQAVADLPDPRTKNPGRIHSNGTCLSLNSHFQFHVVLSQRFAIAEAGEYSLTVQVHLPYAPQERNRSIRPEQFEAVYDTVFRAEYSFPFSVTEADPARLRSLAETLASQFAQSLPSNDSVLVGSLFSMPEEYALLSWKKVAQASSLSHLGNFQETANELTRLNTITAADILADMIWNPPQTHTTDGSRLISSWRFLHNMYFNAGPELQQHLQSVFREHGWTIDPKPRF